MAHFTSSAALSMVHGGYHFVGEAGTVFWLPDAMVAAFKADPGPVITGLTWIDEVDPIDGADITDDTIDLDAKAVDESLTTPKVGPEAVDFDKLAETADEYIASGIANSMFATGALGALALGSNRDDAAGHVDLDYMWCWRPSGSGIITRVADSAWPGGYYLKMAPAATGTPFSNSVAVTTDKMLIDAIATVSPLWWYAVNRAAGEVNWSLNVHWYDATKTYISTNDGLWAGTEATSVSRQAWTVDAPEYWLEPWATAPDNARYVRLEWIVWETTTHSASNYFALGPLTLGKMPENVGIKNLATNVLKASERLTPPAVIESSAPEALGNVTFDWDDYGAWLNVGDGSVARAITGGGAICIVKRDATQTIGDSSATALSFTGAEIYDPGGWHSPASNADKVYAPKDGWYLLIAKAQFATNPTGKRAINVMVNGGEQNVTEISAVGGARKLSVSWKVYMTAGQYAQAAVWQNSGGNLDVDAGASLSVSFEGS
jgi:hypothetical protein